MARTLDRHGHEALLLTIQSRQAARQDATIRTNEALQQLGVFVINVLNAMFRKVGGLPYHIRADLGRGSFRGRSFHGV